MLDTRLIEGRWADVLEQATLEVRPDDWVRVELPRVQQASPQYIYAGMFPELKGLTDADFKAAEWNPAAARF